MQTSIAQHPPVGRVYPSADNLTMHNARLELADIIGCDAREVPQVFAGSRPRALKVGIYFELLRLYPGADRFRLGDFLGRYTATRAYLRRIAMGRNRHDLDGADAVPISDASRARARVRLSQYDAQDAHAGTTRECVQDGGKTP